MPSRRRKRQRLGDSTVPAQRQTAERPNQVWALDFQFEQTADGRILKLLNIVDEHTREALAIEVARRAMRQRAGADRGRATGLVPLHRHRHQLQRTGQPWQNPYVASFTGRLRDELLAVEQFDTLLDAQVVIEDCRTDYNTRRPHSSLGQQPPAVYAANYRTTHP